MSQYSTSEPNVNITAAMATGGPADRVRWGPIIAGLFAAMATLIVLAVLGVAVAGTAYDPGDSARAFGIGAGIWGAASVLIAFFVGGWLASRSAAVRGTGNGVLNGAMVWVVAIPMIIWTIAGGVGSLFRGATSVAPEAARATQENTDAARTASARIEDTARKAVDEIKNPNTQRDTARTTAKSAWGTLVSLLVGLGAAALGGWTGARMPYRGDRATTTHHTTTTADRPHPTDRV